MAKTRSRVLNGRCSSSAFSRNTGIVRRVGAKRRWRLLASVFRFVCLHHPVVDFFPPISSLSPFSVYGSISSSEGIVRRVDAKRRWRLLASVFRFVCLHHPVWHISSSISPPSPFSLYGFISYSEWIVRRVDAKRRWRLLASVFRFVCLRRRVVDYSFNGSMCCSKPPLFLLDLLDTLSYGENSYFGLDSIPDGYKLFVPTDGEDRAALGSISDSSNDGQDGDFGCLTGKNDYTVKPNGSVLCNKSWQKGELLGSGSAGFVYEGFTEDGLFFAVKEVSLLDQGSQGQQILSDLEQEIFLLRQLQHENIVRYLGTDRNDAKLYIFLELVTKGSLMKLYETYELSDSHVSAYTRQILNGLNYLHSQNVVHRDVKCANILVDATGSVKLADFGLAKVTTLNDIKSCKGSPRWMAPEVVNQKNHRGYGCAADIWSLGCTVLEMLTSQFPYSDLESMAALFKIGQGGLPTIPHTVSDDARDFILKCLQVNPDYRPTAAQLLEHPFVKKPPSTFPSPISPLHRAEREEGGEKKVVLCEYGFLGLCMSCGDEGAGT